MRRKDWPTDPAEHGHGVGTARAVRIYKTCGSDAVQVMTENPYRLARDIQASGGAMAGNFTEHRPALLLAVGKPLEAHGRARR